MRLLDQVAQAVHPVSVVHPRLGNILLPGAERFASQMGEVGSRLVLQPDVTRTLGGMILSQPDLLTECLDLVRIPARTIWIEWDDACLSPETERLAGGPGQRAGILVHGDEAGRAGTLRSFWRSEFGAEVSAGELHFDLDEVVENAAGGCDDELQEVLSHTRLVMDPLWEAYYRHAAPDTKTMHEAWKVVRSTLWRDMLVLLGYSLMAGMRSELTMEPSDLDRLNRARRKRKVPELLGFVEVGVGLFGRRGPLNGGAGSSSNRSASRLHHVRGHFVRRGDILFWRRPHLRGDVALGPAPTRVTRMGLTAAPAIRAGRNSLEHRLGTSL